MLDVRLSLELHARALELWTQTGEDGDRSILYAQTEVLVIAEAPKAVAVGRASKWVQALVKYEQFWQSNGRRPREHTRNMGTLPQEERRMGAWARYQRRFEHKLSSYQRIRLDLSPAFQWDPLDNQWQDHLTQCMKHTRVTGRLPFLNSTDRSEFLLARWLGRQLRQLRGSALRSDRAEHVTELLVFAQALATAAEVRTPTVTTVAVVTVDGR